jgi:hypothetical protein
MTASAICVARCVSIIADNIVIDCRISDYSDDSEEEDNEDKRDVKLPKDYGKSADLGATFDTDTAGKSVTG